MVPRGGAVAELLDGLVDEGTQTSVHGVDLTVGRIEELTEQGRIDFDNSSREVPRGRELEVDGEVTLDPGAYRVTYNEMVEIPLDHVGVILPRSSLMRSGAVIYSALWDAGYEGRGQGLLRVMNPHGLVMEEDARVGQLFLLEAEPGDEGYDGIYQRENV